MKNYLCIDGKKIELTPEQVKQLTSVPEPVAKLSNDGKIATIGEHEFIVLENNEEKGIISLLLKDLLCNSRFGDNCDFEDSEIKEKLKEFADNIANLIGEDNILTHDVDLTTDDGLKYYGETTAKMSLLTCNMYRKYAELIDKYKLNKYWWLVTPYSAPSHYESSLVKCVAPSGYLSYGSSNDYGDGVRPFCILKSNIFVS